jgi:lipid II:glycine glycyltransferase (peptidoglycan interpeptide bridge formation enzyme)
MRRVSTEFRIISNLDTRAWDDFAIERGGHLLQSAAWGELKARFGWSAQRVALAHGDTLNAGAQMLFRRLPLGLWIAYVPRGPIADLNDRDALAALLDALCATARARGAFALKIEPNWLNPPISNSSTLRQAQGRLSLGASLQSPTSNQLLTSNSIQPRTTIHIDLTRDLNAILAQMKPKWRYNIRLAERKGVIVRAGTADDIGTFYDLLKITSVRDAFAIHSEHYYRAAFELLVMPDHARLFVAEYEREPLAAIFVTAFGDEAIYLYGASSNAHRERMPNHALHWAAMQWAKARGCTRYDLWGIGAMADSDTSEAHGLYQFKQGFGGSVVQYAGAYDAVFSRVRYALYTRAVAWRRGTMG